MAQTKPDRRLTEPCVRPSDSCDRTGDRGGRLSVSVPDQKNQGKITMIDEEKLHQFIGQMLGDLGGAASISMVRIGDALGLYRALHAKGSMTCAELAQEVGVNQRYLREWLSQQAASNYLSYEPASCKFTLPPEQAMVFADEDSPVYMMGGFDLMASLLDAQPKVQEAFKTGRGVRVG